MGHLGSRSCTYINPPTYRPLSHPDLHYPHHVHVRSHIVHCSLPPSLLCVGIAAHITSCVKTVICATVTATFSFFTRLAFCLAAAADYVHKCWPWWVTVNAGKTISFFQVPNHIQRWRHLEVPICQPLSTTPFAGEEVARGGKDFWSVDASDMMHNCFLFSGVQTVASLSH